MSSKTDLQVGESILRPRARIIKTIGEELISNEVVSIIELVKNSYDADASTVEIKLSGNVIEIEESRGKKKKFKKILKKEGAYINIWDDGSGMSLDIIKEAWMEPATIMKRRRKTSYNKSRRYTGEKGIGRFASAKLASNLTIITKEKNDNEVVVDFKWKDFYDESKYLDEIKCAWSVREPESIKIKGTILNLFDLNSDWDERKIKELRVALSRLINPVAPIEDFIIDLVLPEEFNHLSGWISAPESINKPEYSIKGNINKLGEASIIYTSKKKEIPKPYKKEIVLTNPTRIPSCGSFDFELRAWDLDDLSGLAKEIGSTTKNIKDDLKELGGINIYRDNFRVLPYGEPQNDWLRLDMRRVNNPTLRLSNNQIVGYVSIGLDNNPELTDQSNREGIVDTQEFTDFQSIIIQLLSEIEEERYKQRPREEEKQKESLFQNFSIDPIVEIIEEKLPKDKEVLKIVKSTQDKIQKGVKKVQEVISRYRRLSTLGLLIDVIIHDGSNFVLKIDNETRLILKDLQKKEIDINSITKRIENIQNQKKIISELFKRLQPFGGRKRGKPSEIIFEHAIKNVFNLYHDDLNKLNVNYTLPDTETIVTIDNSELQIIIVNLLQNSLYWLETQNSENNAIIVDIQIEDDELSLVFSDNGPGINEENHQVIFDPYFSSKPYGIGLGLTIIGELVSEYNGEFYLIENGPLDGATFKLTFLKRI